MVVAVFLKQPASPAKNGFKGLFFNTAQPYFQNTFFQPFKTASPKRLKALLALTVSRFEYSQPKTASQPSQPASPKQPSQPSPLKTAAKPCL